MDFDKFCKCIDINKMLVRTIANYFSFFLFQLSSVRPLIDVRILFPFNILRTN